MSAHQLRQSSDAAVRLTELAETFRREHALAQQAGEAVIRHAIAAGDALIEARRMVPDGEWVAWVMENAPDGKGYWACQYYMRLAGLKDQVDPSLSISANLRLLAGLDSGRRSKVPDEVRTQAVRLAKSGEMSIAQVARECGVDDSTVKAWVDPEWAREKEARRSRRQRPRAVPLQVARKVEPEQRALKYGEPGRESIGRAVRMLAQARGTAATREALLDLAAIASAWAARLSPPTDVEKASVEQIERRAA